LNCSELKVCMRRKFTDGKKEFVWREKEFREKVQSLIREKAMEEDKRKTEEKKKKEKRKRKRKRKEKRKKKKKCLRNPRMKRNLLSHPLKP